MQYKNKYRDKSLGPSGLLLGTLTQFFHANLKARQSRNRISSIFNPQGDRLTDPTIVHQEFTAFFQQLLGTAATEIPCLDTEIARDGIQTVTKKDVTHVVH